MRSGCVEQDQVEPPVNDRAYRSALAMHFVAIEMLIVELEAVCAEEWAGRKAGRLEIHGACPDPEQAFDHRRDFRRGHVGPELGHLPVVATPLIDQRFAVLEAGDE